MLFHGLRLLHDRLADRQKYRDSRRRRAVDRDASREDRHGGEGEAARHSAVGHREVPAPARRQFPAAGDEQREIQPISEGTCRAMRHREARHLTPGPAYVRHDHHALERCASRNGQ